MLDFMGVCSMRISKSIAHSSLSQHSLDDSVRRSRVVQADALQAGLLEQGIEHGRRALGGVERLHHLYVDGLRSVK